MFVSFIFLFLVVSVGYYWGYSNSMNPLGENNRQSQNVSQYFKNQRFVEEINQVMLSNQLKEKSSANTSSPDSGLDGKDDAVAEEDSMLGEYPTIEFSIYEIDTAQSKEENAENYKKELKRSMKEEKVILRKEIREDLILLKKGLITSGNLIFFQEQLEQKKLRLKVLTEDNESLNMGDDEWAE